MTMIFLAHGGQDGILTAPRRGFVPRRGGFSMMELLLVLSMMALVGIMAFPRTSSMITQWRLSRAAQAVAEELQSAYSIVGRSRKPITITIDKAQMEIRLSDRNQVIYRRRNVGVTSEYKLDPANLITNGEASTLMTHAVEVFPPGLSADSLSIEFSRQGAYRRVRMLRGGIVQVCSNRPTLNAVCVPA
jgi:Tfp pilus assembly protein FimT